MVRDAAMRTYGFMAACYNDGFAPPSVLCRHDASDSNGFQKKPFITDPHGAISAKVAMINNRKAWHEESVTMDPPNRDDGKPFKPSDAIFTKYTFG
jgi:hypothetical protein